MLYTAGIWTKDSPTKFITMNGGFVDKNNNSGSKIKPKRLFSRVTKKPIKGAPSASNKNTKVPMTTPPEFPNIRPFHKGGKPLPKPAGLRGKVTDK